MELFPPRARKAPAALAIFTIALSLIPVAAGGQASDARALGVSVPVPGGSYRNIDPGLLAAMLAHKDFVLVNVHVPYAGEIAGTDSFVRFDRTAAQLGDYPKDKSAKIVVYCRSGAMSDLAARELVKAGYTKVLNLEGGMNAWEKAGFAIAGRKD